MKLTQILFAHHVGRMIQKHWYIQGRIKVIPTPTESILKSHGYEVIDVLEFLKPPKMKEKLEFVGLYDREIPKDINHPDYKQEPCFIFKNEDVLLEGINQAKALTNTVEISEGLPDNVANKEEKIQISKEIHLETQKKIKLCCMFDATQKKLPKRKDPLKPMWVFPNEYGITASRKNELLCKNLVQICEMLSSNKMDKSIILDSFFCVPLKAYNKNIQLELSSELLVTTKRKINTMADPSSTYSLSRLDLYPMDCTADLKPYHFYEMKNVYSPGIKSKWPFVQTAFVHFNSPEVKNVINEPVDETQIVGRSLMKGFCIAAAQAQAAFGDDVKELPEPIVVPVVQTDGKMFHFSIFQLNTLDIDSDSQVKNIFWNLERIPLYSACEYRDGRPVLEDYNPDVIRKLVTFYNI